MPLFLLLLWGISATNFPLESLALVCYQAVTRTELVIPSCSHFRGIQVCDSLWGCVVGLWIR